MSEEIRFRNPIKAIGYSIVSHAILLDSTISDGALRLYMLLLMHAQQTERCWPGIRRLAEMRSISERAVKNHMAELVAAGYITRQRRPNQSSITWIEDIESNPRLAAVAALVVENRSGGTNTPAPAAQATSSEIIEKELDDRYDVVEKAESSSVGQNSARPVGQNFAPKELISRRINKVNTYTARARSRDSTKRELNPRVNSQEGEEFYPNTLPEKTERELSIERGLNIERKLSTRALSTERDSNTERELEYVDLSARSRFIPKWRYSTGTSLCERALKATGRKYFQDRQERSRWVSIEKSVAPLSLVPNGKYPTEWVEQIIAWAEKNNARQMRITFPSLLSAIENSDRKNDWLANRKDAPGLDQPNWDEFEAPPDFGSTEEFPLIAGE